MYNLLAFAPHPAPPWPSCFSSSSPSSLIAPSLSFLSLPLVLWQEFWCCPSDLTQAKQTAEKIPGLPLFLSPQFSSNFNPFYSSSHFSSNTLYLSFSSSPSFFSCCTCRHIHLQIAKMPSATKESNNKRKETLDLSFCSSLFAKYFEKSRVLLQCEQTELERRTCPHFYVTRDWWG